MGSMCSILTSVTEEQIDLTNLLLQCETQKTQFHTKVKQVCWLKVKEISLNTPFLGTFLNDGGTAFYSVHQSSLWWCELKFD